MFDDGEVLNGAVKLKCKVHECDDDLRWKRYGEEYLIVEETNK
jgi:hypothetical protein